LKIKLLVFTVLVLKFDLKTFSGDYNIKKYRNIKKNLVIITSKNTEKKNGDYSIKKYKNIKNSFCVFASSDDSCTSTQTSFKNSFENRVYLFQLFYIFVSFFKHRFQSKI